jgi:uncharacterized protein YjiS (DUF1127 family)
MPTSITPAAANSMASASHLGAVLRFATGADGWLERRRQLRALSELDERLLRDIGLARKDVRRACSRRFWMRRGRAE